MKKHGVYILKCEDGRYYVGHSDDIEKRIKQHFGGKGSKWTKKHRPTSVLKTYPGLTTKDESRITKEMMHKHGAENVRGGLRTYTKSPHMVYSPRTKKYVRSPLRKTCAAYTAYKKKCQAPPMKKSSYCVFHRRKKS